MNVPVPVVRLWPSNTGSQQAQAFAGCLPAPQLVVTDGILHRLSAVECDAVVAHELGHVANGSLWLLTAVIPVTRRCGDCRQRLVSARRCRSFRAGAGDGAASRREPTAGARCRSLRRACRRFSRDGGDAGKDSCGQLARQFRAPVASDLRHDNSSVARSAVIVVAMPLLAVVTFRKARSAQARFAGIASLRPRRS